MNKIRVVELFAGVGGFRIGLEGYPKKRNSFYEVVWSNQWEPSTKMQHANMVYEKRWGAEHHCGDDISTVDISDIPDHDCLVGGFPCQDYSVATTLKRSGGLIGKKGVLWWQIFRILDEKGKKRPNYLILENVDRLLKSPASQRGRDFAMILASLNKLGYAVEWKVINAADYGMPQRRRRVFIVAYHKDTLLYNELKSNKNPTDKILNESILGNAFPSHEEKSLNTGTISDDLKEVSDDFNKGKKLSPFESAGYMINGTFYTLKTKSSYKGKRVVLKDIVQSLDDVDEEFIIDSEKLEKWEYLKGSKNEKRYNKAQNFWYTYNEGSMIFPDPLEKPSRTIITGEGGKSASRFKHIIDQDGVLRRLTPLELERLNMFPDNHTELDGVTNAKRAFFMGNALVVGVVEKIGDELKKRIKE